VHVAGGPDMRVNVHQPGMIVLPVTSIVRAPDGI
jgi:hypothetical protein